MPHNYYNRLRGPFLLLATAALLFAFAGAAQAATLKLAWDPSSDPNVVGYSLSYGTTSGHYTQSLNAGGSTAATVTSLTPGATYYFVVTAYNSIGLQSLPSNEISLTMPSNQPPTVSMTSPQSGASLSGLTPISVSATASDPDGTVVKVEFYQDTNKIGEATSAPYSAVWNNAPSGNFVLTALAYDDSGAAVRSTGVPIAVTGTSPAPSPSPAAITKVRVYAPNPFVRAGSTAQFKISASDLNMTQPMAVNYTLGGTATGGVDYSMAGVTGQVMIPAGSRGVTLPLATVSVPGSSGRKTAILTIMPGTGYAPGRGATAIVRIISH